MKAIARLSFAYLASLPLQRWLAGIVGGLLLLEILRRLSVDGTQRFASFVAMVIVVSPVVVMAGLVFGTLSARRTHRFVPHFRVKALLAILLTLVLITLAWSATLWMWPPVEEPAPLVAVGFVYPMFWLSVLVLGTFLTNGSPDRLALALPVLYALILWLSRGGPAYLEATGIDPVGAVVLLTTLFWVIFGAWYLRARHVVPLNWLGATHTLPNTLTFDTAAEIPRKASIGIYLAGRYVWSSSRKLLALFAAASAIPTLFWIVSALSDVDLPRSTLLSVPLTVMLLCWPQARQVVRRSRLLWLKSGQSRAGLFLVAEREVVRSYLWNAGLTALMITTLTALFPGVGSVTIGWILVLSLATGLCAMYLGLMGVQTFGLFDLATVLSLVVSECVAVWAILGEPLKAPPAIAIVIFQLTGALMCRASAKRRWRQIDWLRFRPPQLRSQALRLRS